MNTIYTMFPSTLDIKDKMDESGIRIPDTFRFSDVNIVIGKNGAGKTRFLRTLKALYESERAIGNVELLYGYFPGLSDRCLQGSADLPEHELREFLDQPEVSFDDFFKEIEAQSADFLSRLLDYHSRHKKEENENILNRINDFFSITGKKLIVYQRESSEIVSSRSSATVKVPQIPENLAVQESDKKTTNLETAIERFSPGERLLLYMAIFFALRRNSNQERVIILDEPETHLHPQALLAFVRTLKKHFAHTTVWIATHSLFLLPEFRFENIVYMKDGEVIPRDSSLYEDVFTALLGEDNEETRRFFASLPHWQYVEFVTECFSSPSVVDIVDPKDEQVQLFVQALEKHQIRCILDCGGGSGRLGLSLKAAHIPLDTYDIYDPCPSYHGDEFTVYTRLEDIDELYDCVVMMNLLHEVEPSEWPVLFHTISTLIGLSGNLFFVEVTALKDGEWPNETGYMVLGKSELAALFDVVEDDLPEIRIQGNQKSVGILIPGSALEKVTMETVSASIKRLEVRTYAELRHIRSEEAQRRRDGSSVSTNARRYAFLSQQYINAKLFNDIVQVNMSLYQIKNKDEKLVLMLKAANSLIIKDSMADAQISGGTRSIFKSTVDFYRKNGFMTAVQRNRCTKYLQIMQDRGVQKQTIDTFLALLVMMGDNSAMRHLDPQVSAHFFDILSSV